MLVECESSQMIGAKNFATKSITFDEASAIGSARCKASRFGTNSPNTNEI